MVDYVSLAQNTAYAYGVPPQLFTDLIKAESGFNPVAYNPSSGASGIAQILPSTAANPGYGLPTVNPWNPQAALQFAAQYLQTMYQRFGSWGQAVLSYAKGPGYAANHPNEVPYPGSASILSDLRNLAGNSGNTATNPAGNGPAAYNTAGGTDSGTSDNGCTGWLTTPGACGYDLISRAGYVLLGLVVIAAGLWLLSK